MNPAKETLEKINLLQKSLSNQYSELIKSYIVYKDQLSSDHTIVDTNWIIHETYGINKPAVLIVRPDTYCAYYPEDLNIEPIEKFLRTYLY